jgi:hypothetical protein
MIEYQLPGTIAYQQRVYPDPATLNATAKLPTYEKVIEHFTRTSLAEDLIAIEPDSLQVTATPTGYVVSFTPQPGYQAQAQAFAAMAVRFLDARHAGLALDGTAACAETPAWNPMAGFPVNRSDGPCEWYPCLPLGLPLVNHLAVTLLHYPPLVAYRNADYLHNNTLERWKLLLQCVGIEEPKRYHSILDVNPIAAPGSGQSEYPNDYFPISLTSQFFDNERRGLTYVQSMLELMLNPPSTAGHRYTLPLLVCGSPLYDPQAPGWFRTRYKDQLPLDPVDHTPLVHVLQAGLVRISPHSERLTPYMVANHMIAAGVTGKCTDDPSKIPNIRKYEAQDLVAATFLSLYGQNPDVHPEEASQKACQRWFGADDGHGAPNPGSHDDLLTICALAQVDLCFDVKKLAPRYTFDEAKARCLQSGGADYSPCFGCQ